MRFTTPRGTAGVGREGHVRDLLAFVDDPEGFCSATKVPFSPGIQRVHAEVRGELHKRVAAQESLEQRLAWIARLKIVRSWQPVKEAVEEWAAGLPVVMMPTYRPLERVLEMEWLTPPKAPGGPKPWAVDLERLYAVLRRKGVDVSRLNPTVVSRRQYRYLWALEQVPRPIRSRKTPVRLPVSERTVTPRGLPLARGLTLRERTALGPVLEQLKLSSAWVWGLCPYCRRRFVVRVGRATFCLTCRAIPRKRRWARQPNPQWVQRVLAALPTGRPRAMTRQQVHAALGADAPSLEMVSNILRHLRAAGLAQCEGTGKRNSPRRWWATKNPGVGLTP